MEHKFVVLSLLLIVVQLVYTNADPVAGGGRCPPMCRRYCPLGFVRDSRNCPTCTCRRPPRPTTPRRCGPVCLIYCQYGNVLDARGCPTCKCKSGPKIPSITLRT